MTPDVRRALSIGSFLLILVLSLTLLVWAGLGWRSLQANIERAAAESQLPPAADPARYLSPGSTFGEASSSLQSRVRTAARNAGFELDRVEIDEENTADPLAMRVRFEAEGRMDSLMEFIHTLEANTPALIVENVEFSTIRNRTALSMEGIARARREPGEGS